MKKSIAVTIAIAVSVVILLLFGLSAKRKGDSFLPPNEVAASYKTVTTGEGNARQKKPNGTVTQKRPTEQMKEEPKEPKTVVDDKIASLENYIRELEKKRVSSTSNKYIESMHQEIWTIVIDAPSQKEIEDIKKCSDTEAEKLEGSMRDRFVVKSELLTEQYLDFTNRHKILVLFAGDGYTKYVATDSDDPKSVTIFDDGKCRGLSTGIYNWYDQKGNPDKRFGHLIWIEPRTSGLPKSSVGR